MFVRALKGKRLELSTPNLVYINYSSRAMCIDPEVKDKDQGHKSIKCTWRGYKGQGHRSIKCTWRGYAVDSTAYVSGFRLILD